MNQPVEVQTARPQFAPVLVLTDQLSDLVSSDC